MTTLAVIPVQRLATAKSRLATRLTPAERQALVLALLDHELRALREARRVDHILVVSPDPDLLDYARARGAEGLPQAGDGLNAGLRLAQAAALRHGAETLVIILGDLPLVTGPEIDALLGLLPPAPEPGIVLAPDRHGLGTNVAALRPPNALDPAFGAASFRRHQAAAQQQGITPREFHAPGTGFDIDTPTDLDELTQADRWQGQARTIASGEQCRPGATR